MNALTIVQPDPSVEPLIRAVAIRLADEGIPVRAIARATRLPSDEVYETLREALATGSIVEIPKDDWPLGSSRASRNPCQDTSLEQEDALKSACARYFKATPLEAAMLAVMLKRNETTKEQLHTVIEQNRPSNGRDETDPKMVDVMICKLRKKLKLHDIVIETMWGTGYFIAAPYRERAIMVLTTFAAGPAPALLQQVA